MTADEREHDHALAMDALRFWLVNAPSQAILDQHTASMLDAIARAAKAYDRTDRRMDGVETRHGRHQRYVAMRQGLRQHFDEPHGVRWYVLDNRTDMASLAGLHAKHAFDVGVEWGMREDDDDFPWHEVRERMDRNVAEDVYAKYGEYPEAYSPNRSYSPSGEWFSYVRYREVGRRVLVAWCHSQDV
jgi:hypothetical protein